jgi:hypothetical protein
MKIDLNYKARVTLTPKGLEVLAASPLAADVAANNQLDGDTLSVPLWKLMALFGPHLSKRPTDKHQAIVENEIELESSEVLPTTPLDD